MTGDHFFLDPNSWKIIWCRFDGIDYLHSWRGGALVWWEATSQAIHVSNEDIPLFINHTQINKGDRVLIAGAGMGSELYYFSEKVGSRGVVLAIEPDKEAFRRLSKLARLLPFENVHLFNCAVGSESGTALLLSPDSSTVSNTLITSGNSSIKSETVMVETIENICKQAGIRELNYLKMNIEGSEFSALKGVGAIEVEHFCISCHDFLGAEFRTRDSVVGELSKKGYRVWKNEEVISKPWVGSYIYANLESS